jgi:hypothetical protein
VTTIWWSARLSCLSPPRSSLWRIVWPDEADWGGAGEPGECGLADQAAAV